MAYFNPFGQPFGNPGGVQPGTSLPMLLRQQFGSPGAVPGPMPGASNFGSGPMPIPNAAPPMTPGFRAGGGMPSSMPIPQAQGFNVPQINGGALLPPPKSAMPAPGAAAAVNAGVSPSDYAAIFGGPTPPASSTGFQAQSPSWQTPGTLPTRNQAMDQAYQNMTGTTLPPPQGGGLSGLLPDFLNGNKINRTFDFTPSASLGGGDFGWAP